MPGQTRPTTLIFVMTSITVVVAGLIGAAAGIYLGRRYQPRSMPVQMARQVPAASSPGPISPPASSPPRAVRNAVAPAKSQPRSAAAKPAATSPSTAARTQAAGAPRASRKPAGPIRERAAASREQEREARPEAHVPLTSAWRPRRSPPTHRPVATARPLRLASAARLSPLRPVGIMRPARPLPVPRELRQRRLARALAASRRHRVQVARRQYGRRGTLLRLRPVRPASPIRLRAVGIAAAATPVTGMLRWQPLTPAERAGALARAEQTVRYLEQPILLEGRPATLATYTVWERGKPRTFSFVRQDQRTDLAKIVRVNEPTRLVTVFVPDRGAVIRTVVPTTAMVAYSQALQLNPAPADLLARADAAGGAAPAPVLPPAAAPPVERVAGLREQMPELVGLVQSVDPATRTVVMAGPRQRTPFRVAPGIALPAPGQIVAITTTTISVSPRPATSVTVLQPTVAGTVILVRPTAVELTVKTVAPDGQVEEVPVPVSGDARVFIRGQPEDLRALRKGIYIRAYMTPSGEARILGLPSE